MYYNHLVLTVDASLTVDVGFKSLLSPDGFIQRAAQNYTPDRSHVNFIMPDVGVPRFKLKVFADENKMKNTNKIDKANVIIFSEHNKFKNYNNITTTNVDYLTWRKVETSTIIDYSENLIEAGYHGHVSEKTLMKLKALSKTNKYIYCDDASNRRFFSEIIFRKLGKWLGTNFGDQYPIYNSELLDQLILENPNILLVEERSIQSHLSKDSIVIDQKKYTELCKLIDTQEQDNVVLAMEIMANCNFSQSIVPIFQILITKGDILYRNGNVNHVNFKYLLNYFDYSSSSLSNGSIGAGDVEGVFRILKTHNQFTKEVVDTFLSFYNEQNQYSTYEGQLTNNRLKLNDGIEYDQIDDEDEIMIDDE
jgi:hypothetical protein